MPTQILTQAQVGAVVDTQRARVKAVSGIDVPHELAMAIIDRESYPRYNTLSYRKEPNGKESFGLMQILSSTARGIGFKGVGSELYLPAVGVFWGMLYLATQLKRYKGDVTKAVAAYNAGSARPDGKGGYITTAGYVPFVLSRVQFWLAQAASHPATAAAIVVAAGLATLWISRGRS